VPEIIETRPPDGVRAKPSVEPPVWRVSPRRPLTKLVVQKSVAAGGGAD
jgi:hypothetical protein